VSYYNLKKEIVETFKMLVEKNMSSRYGGNISIRTPDKADHFLITPSGIRKDMLKPEDIIVIDDNGNVIEGAHKPSIEMRLHLSIYKARPDISAVIHAHTIYSSAFAVARMDIPPLIEEYVVQIGGGVKVSKFARAGSEALAKNIVNALGHRKAALVANHGVVACGKNLEDAVTILFAVEKMAMLYILARTIGEPHVLPPDVVNRLVEIYKKRTFQ